MLKFGKGEKQFYLHRHFKQSILHDARAHRPRAFVATDFHSNELLSL